VLRLLVVEGSAGEEVNKTARKLAPVEGAKRDHITVVEHCTCQEMLSRLSLDGQRV